MEPIEHNRTLQYEINALSNQIPFLRQATGITFQHFLIMFLPFFFPLSQSLQPVTCFVWLFQSKIFQLQLDRQIKPPDVGWVSLRASEMWKQGIRMTAPERWGIFTVCDWMACSFSCIPTPNLIHSLDKTHRRTDKLTNGLAIVSHALTGQKFNFYFRGLLFTSHWLNLQHWTGFYIAVYGNFQGLFFIFEGSFLHFGGEIAQSPSVIFSLHAHLYNLQALHYTCMFFYSNFTFLHLRKISQLPFNLIQLFETAWLTSTTEKNSICIKCSNMCMSFGEARNPYFISQIGNIFSLIFILWLKLATKQNTCMLFLDQILKMCIRNCDFSQIKIFANIWITTIILNAFQKFYWANFVLTCNNCKLKFWRKNSLSFDQSSKVSMSMISHPKW